MASSTTFYATAILAKISKICVKLADYDSIRIELRGAIVVLPPNLQLVSGIWSCEHCGKLLAYALMSTQS